MDSPPPSKNIAVLVVHGVGAQQPGQSVRQVGDLLLRAAPAAGATIEHLAEHTVRVPLRPALPAPSAPSALSKGNPPTRQKGAFERLFSFDERSPYVRRQLDRKASRPAVLPGEAGYEFMRAQLVDYRPEAEPVPELTYEAAGLRGEVLGADRSVLASVHLHEMFWADLGRIGSGLLAVFGHLYQLLIHLPSLGRNTADFAAIENAGVPGWRLFMHLHNGANRLLTLPIPILNLLMAMASLVALAGVVGLPQVRPVAMILAALLAVATTAFWLWRRPPASTWAWYARPLVVGGLLLAGALGAAFYQPFAALAIEIWILGGIAVGYVLWRFDKFRPGALAVGILGLLLFSVELGVEGAAAASSPPGIAAVGLRLVEVAAWGLRASWFALAAFFIPALLVSVFALSHTPAERRPRARQATWTAHTTLGLSSALLLILNLASWSAVIHVAARLLKNRTVTPRILPPGLHVTHPIPVPVLADAMLQMNAGVSFVAAVLSFVLLLAAGVWVLMPSILAEIRPPRFTIPRRARRFGAWLSRGLPLLGLFALLLGPALLLGLLVDLVRKDLGSAGIKARLLLTINDLGLGAVTAQLLASIKPLLLVSGVAVLTLVGAKEWLSVFGTVTGVMLEIDNYLREHPRHFTPRARIAERFASLLRHVGAVGAVDSLVIVAHSQGSVIIADLLRFLAIERQRHPQDADPALAWLEHTPVHLVTVGSPLRQLFGRCFPHLYDWVQQPHPWQGPTPDQPWIPADAPPSPAQLGGHVRWTNLYRASDYVGRGLWMPDSASCAWQRCAADPDGSDPLTLHQDAAHTRIEACIGEGAHTHYWDASAADVAVILQQILRVAATAS